MTGRIAAVTLVNVFVAAAVQAGPEPLPAEPPIGGYVWGVVVPAILFAVACGATFFLYRHFAER